MIDDRRAAILQAVVQQYIETSQPVSSSTVAGGVQASSATVRSEMAALEREGYLQQPHTSAGRIPTDQGYRFFVDHLGGPGRLGRAQQQNVREFFAEASGEIEQMLHETGRLLTNLTGAAAVVVGPTHETNRIRSAQIVALSSRNAVVVIVLADGSVEKYVLDLPDGTTEDAVAAASTHLAQHCTGQAVADLAAEHHDPIVAGALQTMQTQAKSDRGVYVGGASQLAAAFEAVETVRNVISILEQQYVVVTLIRDLLDRGVTVSIGGEHNLQPLAHCSLVVAPTLVDGKPQGSVAILGPTRMDYGQALAAVSVVSKQLGERLGDS
jgi:heat-inducible transcriptional repressor